MTLFWGVVITVLVVTVGFGVLSLMLLGVAMWVVDALMVTLEHLEVPSGDDD